MNTTTTELIEPLAEYKRFFPATFSLETPRVILRLISQQDIEHFSRITKDKEIWNYFTKDLSDDVALEQWIEEAWAERANGKRMPFTIIDKDTKEICGSTSLGNISFYDKRVEIGWSCIHKSKVIIP